MPTNAEKTQTQYIDYATTATAITQRRQGEAILAKLTALGPSSIRTGHEAGNRGHSQGQSYRSSAGCTQVKIFSPPAPYIGPLILDSALPALACMRGLPYGALFAYKINANSSAINNTVSEINTEGNVPKINLHCWFAVTKHLRLQPFD